ncbi:MAG TPA: hypothetical protein VFJ19_05570 [Nocardioidaceae bacterium]|nr:hypothetical protein [Nocardioidaceae bacterium]
MNWNFRVNVSHGNWERLPALIDDLARLRLGRGVSLDFALVDDVGIGYTNELNLALPLADHFIRLIDNAIAHGFRVSPLGGSLDDCPFCGKVGGESGAVINADGVLYSCWETAGRPEWAVGTVSHGYDSLECIQDRWVACNHEAEAHGQATEVLQFYERVDAHILDRTVRATAST